MVPLRSQPILLGILIVVASAVPVCAVQNLKTSHFGNAHQVWFQAEDYDERNPDTDEFFPVVDQADAFGGKAVSRDNGAGGMIRWTFDISQAGGKAGTWYFWARQINPGNTSDYMLVEGDPGDPVIPPGPPFPGDSGTPPFDNADDRVFEGDFGPPWQWGQAWDLEGHVKQLRDGENTMYIFHRQGDATVFWDVFMWTDSPDYVPTDEDFQNATAVLPGKALNSHPSPGATDVPRDVVLSWTSGLPGATHDVYFGAVFEEVGAADRAHSMGVLVSQGQTDMTYDPEGVLEFERSYVWRVDEVSAADNTISPGAVWSFTTEPFAYPITRVTATASSAQPNLGPENTINGSGLNANDEHATELTGMWVSSGVRPNWIQYEFDAPYKLHELHVWNSNQMIEVFIGFGAKDVTIEHSLDGITWTALSGVPEFAQATGLPTYQANTIIDFGGAIAKYVRLTINASWGVAPQASLSEVRFFSIPVQARAPQPAVAATGVRVDTELNWRPGREAESHEVYLGADANALTPVDTVTEHAYTPASLSFGTTYFWKVNEVGGSGPYEGAVWSFTTQEYAVIDDFESYDDDDNRIYDTWIDGLTDSAMGGSQVGYDVSPFAERTAVYGGSQAMPLLYDNAAAPFVSEAERTFDSPQNWTTHGADTLSLYFQGAMPGFAETASGSILMNAIGADIWNNADQFRYVYKTLNGNGLMVARVDSLYNSNVWAKGGVMIRQGIEPGSTHAFMALTPGGSGAGNGASFQHRLATNGASTNNDNAGAVVAAPYWVKIERSGNSFTGAISPDGKTWTPLGTAQTITMTGPVLIGLALCSHDAAISTGAEFSNIATTGNVTGAWQIAEIGTAQPAGNSPEGLYLTIKDSAGKSKTIAHPDAAATVRSGWNQWAIPLSEFTSAGVKMAAVRSMTVGVGNKAAPAQGGAGRLLIDDIAFGHPAP